MAQTREPICMTASGTHKVFSHTSKWVQPAGLARFLASLMRLTGHQRRHRGVAESSAATITNADGCSLT